MAFVILAMLLAVSPVLAAPPGGIDPAGSPPAQAPDEIGSDQPAAVGTGIGDAIPLGTSPLTGQLGTESIWYVFQFAAENDQGVVMQFAPANIELSSNNPNINLVSFRVWSNVCPAAGQAGQCEITQVGMGTRSDLPPGVKYWRTGGSTARTFFIEVFNATGQQIAYAIQGLGTQYPPPGLSVPGVGGPVGPSGAPAPAPTPAPAAPTPPPSGPTTPPAPSGATGTGPNNAIPLGTTPQTGQLGTQSIWYVMFFRANNDQGVVMNFFPFDIEVSANDPNINLVSFRVWSNVCTTGVPSDQSCALTQVGMGTRSNLPAGVKYWRTGGILTRTFYIEVFNATGQQVGYAIQGLGTQYPPPGLVVPPVAGPAGPTGAPAPAPSPAPAAPTPPPAPGGGAPATGGTGTEDAILLGTAPMTGQLGAQSIWYQFNFAANNDQGIVLNFQPIGIESSANDPNAQIVSFRVWETVCTSGVPLDQACQLTQVGLGTRSDLPVGVKYWRTGGTEARTFLIEVFNGSGQQVAYAIQALGPDFPPPGLSVPAVGGPIGPSR